METRTTRHLAFLQSIFRSRIDSPDSLHKAIIDAAQHLLPSMVRRFWRYDPGADEFTMQASSVPTPELLSRISRKGSFSGESLDMRRPLYFPDVLSNPMLKNKKIVQQHNLTDCWIIPIFLDSGTLRRPYGTLAIYPTEEGREIQLDVEEVELLCAIANIIERHVPALDHLRLSASLDLGRRPDETTSQFWQRVAGSIADALGFTGCTLFVADHTEERIWKVGGVGFDLEREHPKAVIQENLVEYEKGLSATGYTIDMRSTVYSQDVYLESWYIGRHKGLRNGTTFLATPIWDTPQGHIIGLIRCNDKRRTVEPFGPERISQDDIERVEYVAKELSAIFQHHLHAEHNRVLWALASHDLRAPINAIRDAAGMVLKNNPDHSSRPLGTRERRNLSNVIDNTELLTLLVAMLATGVEDDISFDFRRVPLLGKSLTKIISLLRPTAQSLEVGLSYSTDKFTDFPELWVDQRRIEIAFYNVLMNAIKYSYRETGVNVTWGVDRDSYSISFANYGIGVPPDERESIFRPFVRATNIDKFRVQGKGLGLFIVRRIMRAHNGDIELTQLLTPTVFTLRFPKGLRHGRPIKESSNSR